MYDFKDILGNEEIKDHFVVAVSHEKVSHAYILEGEKGSGKKLLALSFAKLLQCEQKGKKNISKKNEPCGECESCIQMEQEDHPDVILVRHEKPNVISIKEIREQVVNTIDIKPYKGPFKIYIIDEAEKLNNAAQNAILKTIEEPPEYAVILLLTTNRGAFLSTILSRCILLSIKPVADNQVREYLRKKENIEKDMLDFCSRFAMGNIGRAVDMASSQEFLEVREEVLSLMKVVHDIEIYEIDDKIKSLKKWKDHINDYLDIMLMWFRDVLLLKVSEEEKRIIFIYEYDILEKQAQRIHFEGIDFILNEIIHTKSRLKANVNFDASMEVLLLEIRRQFISNIR